MLRLLSSITWFAGAALLLAGITLSWPDEVYACGTFFRRGGESTRPPSLAYEQTLIVFDTAKQREHFIREVVFTSSREPFGFVVPTPTRPKVGKVDASPFSLLRAAFPFREASRTPVARRGGGGKASAGVQVLEQTRVGSFTAFVLGANDAEALATWLRDNGLVSTPQADAWLAHYVQLGFFYVAMRYEPPATPAARTGAETVRISFDSPLPYYPYFEPERASDASAPDPRLLEVWLASDQSWVPVALDRSLGRARWVRPLLNGDTHRKAAREVLAAAIDPSLLPSSDLQVQRFADEKRSRRGFGDIVFVPASPLTFDEPTRTRLGAFMRMLEPSLGAAP